VKRPEWRWFLAWVIPGGLAALTLPLAVITAMTVARKAPNDLDPLGVFAGDGLVVVTLAVLHWGEARWPAYWLAAALAFHLASRQHGFG
jgi:hypothetical protein